MTIASVGFNTGATSAKLNEIITAVNALQQPVELDYAQIVAATAAFTTIVDVAGLSVSFTLTSTRTVNVIIYALVQSSLGADRIQLTLADAANTQLQVTGDLYIPANGSTVPGTLLYRASLVAGPYTYKARVNRQAGTGSCIVNANAARPCFIQALDVT